MKSRTFRDKFDLFNILNTFNWLFHFLVEEFVSFEMYFLQGWRRLGLIYAADDIFLTKKYRQDM